MILILQKTRALIEQGWCQQLDRRQREDGGIDYCLRAALLKASDKDYLIYGRMAGQLRSICQERYFPGIISFNDHPKTTKQDVLDLLDAAIHTEQVRQEIEATSREHKEAKA